jgi:hypothetical protein
MAAYRFGERPVELTARDLLVGDAHGVHAGRVELETAALDYGNSVELTTAGRTFTVPPGPPAVVPGR